MDLEPIDDDELANLAELGQSLITSIFNRKPLSEIEALVKDGAPLWYQDADGASALHAAAYIEDEDIVQYLIQTGATWNSGKSRFSAKLNDVHWHGWITVDNLHNTAGDIALSLNNEPCYRALRDAGIRSGLLFY
jgi:protein arginine N-methyltransferase 2